MYEILIALSIWLIIGFVLENIAMSFYIKRYPDGGSLWPLVFSIARLMILIFVIKFIGIDIELDVLLILLIGEIVSNILKIYRIAPISKTINYYCVFRFIGSMIAMGFLFIDKYIL